MGTSSFVFEVPLCYLRTSIICSSPCHRIVQSAYWYSLEDTKHSLRPIGLPFAFMPNPGAGEGPSALFGITQTRIWFWRS